MLDIISMITFLFIFIGLPMILIIIGGNDKTEEEQKLEDKEQMEYITNRRNKNEKWKNVTDDFNDIFHTSYSVKALQSYYMNHGGVAMKIKHDYSDEQKAWLISKHGNGDSMLL